MLGIEHALGWGSSKRWKAAHPWLGYFRHHTMLIMFGGVSALHGAGGVPAEHSGFDLQAHALRDGAIMACYVRPSAAGQPTLVLIPETHGDRFQFFGPLVTALGPDLGVVIVESRGQGRSWPPPDEAHASIEAYASDVLEIVERLRLDAWYVGGHSLGGMQAIAVAGRFPARLRGVITLEGWVHHRVQADAFGRLPQRTEPQRAEDRKYREDRYARQRWTVAEYDRLVSMWRRWESGEGILTKSPYPLLSVWGDRGMAARPSRETLLLPADESCELLWVRGADHYVTKPEFATQVGEAIRSFIHRIESESSRVLRPSKRVFRALSGDHGSIWTTNQTLVRSP